MQTHLLIIDPQNDFMDVSQAALPVPGAQDDMQRLARVVDRLGPALDAIHVTLDSHHPVDIAHPAWWCDADGQPPAPFTVIGEDDLRQGVWRARDAARQEDSARYVGALAARGRYQLVVWPEHCLIGSWGQAIEGRLFSALNHWARTTQRQVHMARKGESPLTEHYSALQAEVPDADDPRTLADPALLASLRQADRILVAGEALSHCVASTVRDLAALCGDAMLRKVVLIRDCTGPVPGFADQADAFLAEMTARGMRLVDSEALL